jgi:hypothetical protein
MKKIKLILAGRGSECYVHDINEEQKERLVNGGIEDDKISLELVCDILGVEWHEENARIYTGASTSPDSFYIAAYDEFNKLIWESDENFEFNDELDTYWDGYEEVEWDPNKLIIHDYIKGNFKEYELKLEEDFDPNKLSTVIQDVGEIIQLIKDLKYDDKELEDYEWGDYWSKGLSFYLV